MCAIFLAFYRSMMFYFLPPLYAAGAITEKVVDDFGA
jgi:hypothetical protein